MELSELRVTYYQLKEEHQQLQDKMKFYDKVCVLQTMLFINLACSISLSLSLPNPPPSLQESSLDWGEVEEALAIIREKKEKGEPLKSLSFLETLEDNKG